MIKELTNNEPDLNLTQEDGNKFILHRAYLLGDERNFIGSGINFSIWNKMFGATEQWRDQTPFDSYIDIYQKQAGVVSINNIAVPISQGLKFKIEQKEGKPFRVVIEYSLG